MKLKRIRERNQRILTDFNGFIGCVGVYVKKQISNLLYILWEVVFLAYTPTPSPSPLNSLYILYNFPFGFKKDILEI
jgi:hypothetical protein